MKENAPVTSPDDPRLTAYALGELPEGECAEVEAAVNRDPRLQAVVQEIRALGGELTSALGAEPIPAVEAASFLGEMRQERSPQEEVSEFARPTGSKLLRFPGLYYVCGTAAAAGFALLVALWPDRVRPPAEQIIYVPLTFREDATPDSSASPASAFASALATAESEASQSGSLASVATSRLRQLSSQASTGLAAGVVENPFQEVREAPVSSFAPKVDTVSYAHVRRSLLARALPPADEVHIEEMINYFPYDYAALSASDPRGGATAPFSAHLEMATAPWAPEHRLIRVGLKGRDALAQTRAPLNLVFLVDVSGSMGSENKLPRIKHSLRLLLDQLKAEDQVAIVRYAGEAGVALPPTAGSERGAILQAIDSLEPSGATRGGSALTTAYDLAAMRRVSGAVTRVVLCTDGDVNLGLGDETDWVRVVEQNAREGIALNVLGFGLGTLLDDDLERVARLGRGTYHYVDTQREAEERIGEQARGVPEIIAENLRLQVAFNPAKVSRYRLIGFENRPDPRGGKVDTSPEAGKIEAGYRMTALYEVVLTSSNVLPAGPGERSNKSNYQVPTTAKPGAFAVDGLMTLTVSYQEPERGTTQQRSFSLVQRDTSFDDASPDFQFAAAVASFGMMLRESPHRGATSFSAVSEWARRGASYDPGGYRAEFIGLIRDAARIVR